MTGTVVVGIIDDGIAFAHERFRKVAQTRVEHWWLQDGAYQGAGSPVPFGRELRKPDIDALLVQCTHAGAVDEDELYRRAGLIDFRLAGHQSAAWRLAHGTHVMDLACGFDPQAGRDDRPIVCVQLPARVTADTSGANLTPYSAEAIDYILDRADRIAAARGTGLLPVVINFSYGKLAGPDDGTSELEAFIDQRIAARKALGSSLEVVLPAGNAHLSRCHAPVSFQSTTQTVKLHWRVQPDDYTPSVMEIWLPWRAGGPGSSRIKMTVTPPRGPQSPSMGETPGALLQWKSGGKVLCELEYAHQAAPTDRGMFLISLQPTVALDPAAAIAPAGIWTIKLKNKLLAPNEVVDARIQRDDSLYGHPRRGRQSYFDESCYKRYDHAGRPREDNDPTCHVRRMGTLNSIATGRESIVVGGFLRKEWVPARYTCAGPTTPQPGAPVHRDGPDCLTASDDSFVHYGVQAAGSRSGSVVAMNGTSAAAPQLARWIAAERALGNQADRAGVKARAAALETAVPPPPPPRPTVERGGDGRINLDPIITLQRFWP